MKTTGQGTPQAQTVVLYKKVLWNPQGSAAATDAAGPGNEDTVLVDDGSTNRAPGSFAAFLASLT